VSRPATRVAVVDGLAMLALPWLAFGVTDSLPVSASGRWLLAAASSTLALFVGWRGYRHAQAVLAGRSRWFTPALEGFAAGFLPPFLWMTALAANTALAAGTGYDNAASWGIVEWAAYLGTVLELSLLFGCIGAAVGLALSVLNRALLRSAA